MKFSITTFADVPAWKKACLGLLTLGVAMLSRCLGMRGDSAWKHVLRLMYVFRVEPTLMAHLLLDSLKEGVFNPELEANGNDLGAAMVMWCGDFARRVTPEIYQDAVSERFYTRAERELELDDMPEEMR